MQITSVLIKLKSIRKHCLGFFHTKIIQLISLKSKNNCVLMLFSVKRPNLVTSNDLRPLRSQYYVYTYTCIFNIIFSVFNKV